MAEFSKEYCDIWDPHFPHDFSIEKIAKHLIKGNYYPVICEGFSFSAIAKDENGNTLLGFKDYDDDTVVWQDYSTFMSGQFELLKEELANRNSFF